MFQKIDISGVHTNIDSKLRTYAVKKIGNLDRYVPRFSRDSAHLEVHLKEDAKAKKPGQNRCEVTLHLPKETIVMKESGLNMYAAIDITEAKLKQRLKKYKDLHGGGKLRRHLLARLSR